MARDGTKTGGRSKGTPNKKTADVIDRITRVLEVLESKYLDEDIKKLTAAQRVILYTDLLEYKAPKLSRTEFKGDTKNELTIRIVRDSNNAKRTAPGTTSGDEGG